MNEFDLIREVFAKQSVSIQSPDIHVGIGDDSAVITPPVDHQLVTCVDTLLSGRHFPENTAAFAIGYKAVAVNLSDIAAMGAKPHSILLALALPQALKDNTAWLTEFAQGLFSCCHEFGVSLIGGDTTKSDTLTISVTAFGFAKTTVKRSGAQKGDLIAVSGTLGDAAYALQQIFSGKQSALQYRLDTPKPQVALGQWLNNHNIATSMIDISDGLLQDLGHICCQSNVHAKLNIETIPSLIPPQVTQATVINHQLTGGDDYELLFTLNPEKLTQLQTHAFDFPITIIGEITQNLTTNITNNSQLITLSLNGLAYNHSHQGYQHF